MSFGLHCLAVGWMHSIVVVNFFQAACARLASFASPWIAGTHFALTAATGVAVPAVGPSLHRSNIVGYVQQQDVFIGTVTVREALSFSADLRLPVSTTPQQRRAIVNDTLQVLHLDHIADVLIGDAEVRGARVLRS